MKNELEKLEEFLKKNWKKEDIVVPIPLEVTKNKDESIYINNKSIKDNLNRLFLIDINNLVEFVGEEGVFYKEIIPKKYLQPILNNKVNQAENFKEYTVQLSDEKIYSRQDWKTLRLGSTGKIIEEIKKIIIQIYELNEETLDLIVDENYDESLVKSVIKLQKLDNIKETGEIDFNTLDLIVSYHSWLLFYRKKQFNNNIEFDDKEDDIISEITEELYQYFLDNNINKFNILLNYQIYYNKIKDRIEIIGPGDDSFYILGIQYYGEEFVKKINKILGI